MPTHTSAIIPRAKRNAAGEDISRAVVSSRQRRPESNTTSKAIVLRHGRHGVWGEGQIASFKKLSGQEKLALRAAELQKTAVSPPFRLEELMKTAEAEMGEALDLISDLHDAEFFYEDISTVIASRPKLKPELLTAPFIAKTISARVHNAYLLASSWKVVLNVLSSLKDGGLTDSNVRKHLKNQIPARDAYLLVIDTIEMLSNLAQQELSVAVVGSNELGGLFAGTKTKAFCTNDATSVMSAHRSLIDAVIIELVLPESRYEPHILTAVLRDALDTTPREEAKKFSQNVFDALGNFVALIEMKDMLIGQLHGEEGYGWLKMPRKEAAGEIDEFFDAITQSLKASGLSSRWQSWAYPLRKTKSQAQLDDLWKQINTKVYIEETGYSIDSLWRLEDERKPNPQWSTWYIPEFAAYQGDIPSDSESKPFSLPGARQRGKKKEKTALVRGKRRFRDPDGPRPRRAIMNEEDDNDEYDGMPGLMSVSASSDDEGGPESESDADDDEEDEEEEDDESEWEGTENSKMNAMLAEAMREYKRRNGKLPEWTEDGEIRGGDKDFSGNLKTNPFMKMLRSFAGRVFNPDPTFRPPKMGEKPVYGPPRPPPPASSTPATKTQAAAGTPQAPSAPKGPGMTVEDADDEEEGNAEDKKKKKKKKKKPKKKTTAEESAEIKDEIDAVSPVQEFVTPATSPTPAPTTPSNPKSPAVSVTSPRGSLKSPSGAKSMDPYGHGASTVSLPTSIAPSVAQSAHSYLVGKETEAKVKVKTRADPSTINKDGEGTKKKGFFSKITGKKDKKEKVEETKDKEPSTSGGVFGAKGALQLPKRASALVGRLLGSKDDEAKGKAPMRWDHFVKAMKLLGFQEYTGSQGSRVTFHPPDPKDKAMVIHKPHPDPTITPIFLKKLGKRLRENYGWSPEHFESHLGADAGIFDGDLD